MLSSPRRSPLSDAYPLKIDIAKAFDTVRWDFLLACLQSLNLPQDFTQWLAACFTSPSFSVGINGRLHGYFKGTRGLRQGDPMSPYLFGLCFADDILVFTDGSLNSVRMILQVLEESKAFSGLSISIEKSCFFSSGLTEAEVDEITGTCGIPAGSFPIRYLGLPLNTRKLSIANCEPLKNASTSLIKCAMPSCGRVLLKGNMLHV